MIERRHNEDTSPMLWLRDKVLPPLILAGVVGGFTGGWAMYQKIGTVTESIPKINAEIARLNDKVLQQENELTIVRSQMVGWDVMKRIEMGMNAAGREGKGDAAMRAISAAIRSEVEARKEKATQNDRR
jgi:hypothetical protein